jgi:hypothetical protein
MTSYALAPANATVKLINDVAAMLDAGELHAYRVRSNGTMRRLALLPLGSTERETAEWISDAVDMDGRSVQSVSRELHVSAPTVRRFIESLELTEEIEAGEWDGIWTAHDSAASTDAVEEILDQLAGVGRDSREVEAELDAAAAQRAKDAALLAQNQARFAAQKAAAPTVAGDACEAEGTTADELAATLEASVTATKQTGWTMAAKGRSGGVVTCFCNDLGGHRPGGMPGCKNTAPARRVRSHG